MQKPERLSATVRIADNIRAEMARKRLTQGDLAEHLNCSQAAVSRRLSGHTPFDVNELQTIADLLGVAPAYLIGEPERAA